MMTTRWTGRPLKQEEDVGVVVEVMGANRDLCVVELPSGIGRLAKSPSRIRKGEKVSIRWVNERLTAFRFQ